VSEPIVLTFDVDWAADYMVEPIAGALIDRGVRSTWMVTHASPAIDRLRERPDLFELGIHPNFLPGSSHGDTVAEVLATCMRLVPEATTMRSHALVQSSPILEEVLARTPIRCDSSILLPEAPGIEPVGFPSADGPLVRVPYFWEDDVEMMRHAPRWTFDDDAPAEALRVYDFHPALVYLNAADVSPYEELKRLGLRDVPEARARELVQPGQGAGTMFLEIADHLAASGSRTLRDVADAHRRSMVT
jgi:hypothetical protein